MSGNRALMKLKSQKGETIAEVLVASVVIALGMILFVTMINASFRILNNEETAYKEFIDSRNAFERIAENNGSAAGKVTIKILRESGEKYSLVCNDDISIYSKNAGDITFYRYEPKE